MTTPILRRSHRTAPCARRFLLIVAAFAAARVAAGSTTTEPTSSPAAGEESVATKRLRSQGAETRTNSLEGIVEELERLKARIRSLEEEKNCEHQRDGVDPSSRRTAQAAAAPTTVTLAQFNQFKAAITGQVASINQTQQATRSLLNSFKTEITGTVAGIRADLQKGLDAILAIGNKTEKTSEQASEIDAAVKLVTSRVGAVETANEKLTNDLASTVQTVGATTTALAGVADRVDAASQGLDDLAARLACVDAASGADDLIFSGCNVHIRNGAGQTATTNSKGNLIVGYNEPDPTFGHRTGSHMVVVGPSHSWKGYGGIVAGRSHRQESGYASVIGGSISWASGEGSVVIGGAGNQVTGLGSVAVAGYFNVVQGDKAMAAAGQFNSVEGVMGLAGGGSENKVAGISSQSPESYSVVIGGSKNSVTYRGNVVVGGFWNAVPSAPSTASNVVQVGGQSNVGSALDMFDVGVANTRFAD